MQKYLGKPPSQIDSKQQTMGKIKRNPILMDLPPHHIYPSNTFFCMTQGRTVLQCSRASNMMKNSIKHAAMIKNVAVTIVSITGYAPNLFII